MPHVTPVTQNGGTYTVERYVTAINETGVNAGAKYKRLTVVVKWTSGGKTHTRISSTFLSPTKRGLPLPNFKFSNAASLLACRNPSGQVTFAFNLVNNGARDQWLLSTDTASPSWSYYVDTDRDRAYDVGTDPPLDTFNGSPTTGLLDTNVTQDIVAVADVPSAGAQSPPYTWTVGFTATSAAIPTYQQTLATTTTVVSGACGAPTPTPTSPTPTPTTTTPAPPTAPTQPAAPCTPALGNATTSTPNGATMVRYWLYNAGQPGNVNAAADQPVTRDSGTAPAAGSLYDYSSDLAPGTAGRYVNTSGTAVATTASWLYQMPAASQVKKGTGELTLYAAPASGLATATPGFTVTVTVNNAAFSSGTFPATAWGCTGFRAVSVQLPMPNNQSIAANASIRVSVTSSVPVYFAYGTNTFASELELPYTSGNG